MPHSCSRIPQKGEASDRCSCHRAQVFRTLLWLGAAFVLALPAPASAGLSRTESSILREVNRVRAEHGLGLLRYDAHLERAARAHTTEMVRTDAFGHGAFGSRLLQFGVAASTAGENLAWGAGVRGSARSLVAAWLASPGHRANLLSRSFTRVGIGELTGPFQRAAQAHVVTADFAG